MKNNNYKAPQLQFNHSSYILNLKFEQLPGRPIPDREVDIKYQHGQARCRKKRYTSK